MPVFATAGTGGMTVYAAVFLVLVAVAVWSFAGKFFATRPVIAKGPRPLGSYPAALGPIVIGLLILVEGGVFGR